jgi:hypothetical protein
LLACLALALGCGRVDREVSAVSPAAAPAPAAGSADSGQPGRPTLPTLPSAQQRSPDAFDTNGCLVTGRATVDCNQRADQIDQTAGGGGSDDWRTLAGFVGQHYTTDLGRGSVVVLEPAVTTTPTSNGHWSAMGLVRNETSGTLGAIAIEADLRDAAGAVLETVSATSPVTSVRPGEPVPFTMHAPATIHASVASVVWRARGAATMPAGGVGDATARNLELNTFWIRPYGDPKPLDFYLHRDVPGTPHPYVMVGSVLDHGREMTAPHVVVAWLDESGAVVVVRDVTVRDPDGAPALTLRTNSGRDFVVVIDDPVDAAAVASGTPMMWGVGS